ncbi:MAG: hypothetical protein KF870_01295 [Leadbetterella sp.]|nr:hypothetical protein [Leadbetterella sp.]
MKKYALLILLFCATIAFGALVYQAAHEQTALASEEVMAADKMKETQVKEEAFSETTKEIAREGGKSVTRFLFSLIYK